MQFYSPHTNRVTSWNICTHNNGFVTWQDHFNELWSFSGNPAASNTNYITGDGLFTPESMNLWVIFLDAPCQKTLSGELQRDCANDTFVPLLFLCKRAKTFDSTQRVITWGMTSSAHHNQPTAQLMLYCPYPYSLTDPIPSLHLCFSLTIIGICCSCIASLALSSCPCRTLQKLFKFHNARSCWVQKHTDLLTLPSLQGFSSFQRVCMWARSILFRGMDTSPIGSFLLKRS